MAEVETIRAGASKEDYIRQPSGWKTTDPVPLTRQSFLDLLAGHTPLIKIPNFISSEQSTALFNHLSPAFTPYIHATGPAVEKVGIAQFEFQAQSQSDFHSRTGDEKHRYFTAASQLQSLHSSLTAVTDTNLLDKFLSTVRSLVPEWDVDIATEPDGRRYFAGIFRKINGGTPIHCDWCPYDCLTEDWILSKVTCQAVFNLYLSETDGGETTVYDTQWTEEALRFRDEETYGYGSGLVEGRQKVTFKPRKGELWLFNSRNMHEVAPVKGEGMRVAMASFMGLLPAEVTGGRPRLMFWS
ncbi:hypothetical protein BDZ85DRAFT_116284 [Elsinoe ampelina]|uniref:Uncharacterized protein n=1 Tax=Elsinoe ampelina TaxID=302913 RepID=A0A6A6GDT2_9PEZI|nr:hypothetical protein BDZ85DRAFT_116284 [Elsinoe ampelina]